MRARDEAIAGGCPPDLFDALCEFLAHPAEIVERTKHYRYAPNTRARAFQAWRELDRLRLEVLIGNEH